MPRLTFKWILFWLHYLSLFLISCTLPEGFISFSPVLLHLAICESKQWIFCCSDSSVSYKWVHKFPKIILGITCRAKKSICPLTDQPRIKFSTCLYLTGTSWLASCIFSLDYSGFLLIFWAFSWGFFWSSLIWKILEVYMIKIMYK